MMRIASFLNRARARTLQAAFQLLYTRLGFLHEPVGRAAYGPAWDGRRRRVLPDRLSGCLIDLGCGDGRLLARLDMGSSSAFGIDPSNEMARRARDRGADVVVATAQALPFQDESVRHVVATYPGPWIIDSAVWDEIVRVTPAGATVSLLLGGDIRRGRCSRARGLFLHLAYGGRREATGPMPPLGHASMVGDYALVEDEWGTATLWNGVRIATTVQKVGQ